MVARRKIVRVGASLAALGATLAIGLAGNSPANADPKQVTTALTGYGSETLTNLTSAYSGYGLGTYFTPLHVLSTDVQLTSWNALGPSGNDNDCFIPKPGAPSIHRPNGSGEGRGMLSAAFGNPAGALWGHVSTGGSDPTDPCGVKDPTGLIDFARSSSTAPGALGSNPFVNVPVARDALAFAYYKPTGGASPVTNLSIAQLKSLFDNGPQMISNGTTNVLVVPCDINTASGTRGDWSSKIGAIGGSNLTNATEACRLADTAGDNALGQIEENSGDLLTQKGDTIAGTSHEDCDGDPVGGTTPVSCAGAEVIIGFAASGFIAKGNFQNALNGSALLGTITGGDTPVTGSPGTYVANPNYYYLGQGAASTQMGRNVAYVVPVSTLLNSAPGTNLALKAFFRNGTGPWDTDGDHQAEICETTGSFNAQSSAQSMGFLPLSATGTNTILCGDLTQGWPHANLATTPAVDF
jgi:hypothetical protein